MGISFFLAFAAGLLSFVSPCVLPLIPSYLCLLGGTAAVLDAPADAGRPHLIAVTAFFILGFTAVFTALSVIMAGTMLLLGEINRIINLVSGIIVIILGFNFIFNFIKFLNYEKRFHISGPPRGLIGAFFAGTAFGAGWTPCVGPMLGSILLLAGQDGRIPEAALYLCAYSAGLGLPFLGAAFLFNRSLKKRGKKGFFRSHMGLIQKISGIFLVGVGFLIVFGRYQALGAFLARFKGMFFQ